MLITQLYAVVPQVDLLVLLMAHLFIMVQIIIQYRPLLLIHHIIIVHGVIQIGHHQLFISLVIIALVFIQVVYTLIVMMKTIILI